MLRHGKNCLFFKKAKIETYDHHQNNHSLGCNRESFGGGSSKEKASRSGKKNDGWQNERNTK